MIIFYVVAKRKPIKSPRWHWRILFSLKNKEENLHSWESIIFNINSQFCSIGSKKSSI